MEEEEGADIREQDTPALRSGWELPIGKAYPLLTCEKRALCWLPAAVAERAAATMSVAVSLLTVTFDFITPAIVHSTWWGWDSSTSTRTLLSHALTSALAWQMRDTSCGRAGTQWLEGKDLRHSLMTRCTCGGAGENDGRDERLAAASSCPRAHCQRVTAQQTGAAGRSKEQERGRALHA